MKIRSLIIALLCIGIVGPIMAQNKIDKQGRKQGHWVRADKDGAKIYEGTFKDNLEIDTFYYYYPDGTIRLRNIYTTPGRYCSHIAYDEKGRLVATGFYNQKNRDGEWRLYSESGNLVKIAHYRMGIHEGVQVIFTSKGDTAEVSNYTDNHRNGRWWKRIGEKGYITGTFVKGVLQGRLVECGEDGKLVREGNYVNGEKDGQYQYFEKGKLTIDESWKDGMLLDKKVLIMAPNEQFVSAFSIAYFYPKGAQKTIIYMKDGKVLTAQEDIETIYHRLGNEQFMTVDKKNRIAANQNCIIGFTVDSEGRQILQLDPKPSFSVFPDEDCKKLVESLKRIDEMDK